jgi:hypothetical protein
MRHRRHTKHHRTIKVHSHHRRSKHGYIHKVHAHHRRHPVRHRRRA